MDTNSDSRLKVLFLGTGGSFGVPMLGCDCVVCTSDDPRDNRLRTSALLSFDGRNVLIDASPDLRTQALTYGISTLDAVLFTHDHADHTFGVDDLRAYNLRRRGRLPCYGDAATLASIRERFNYIFSSTPALGSRPRLDLCEVDGPFDLWGRTIIPLDVYHGDQTITSYRIGDFGYITDASALPDVTIETLRGVRYLALNALRHEPHPLHLNLSEAQEVAAIIGAETTYLLHLGHEVGHRVVSDELSDGVELAYDGLTLEV